MVDVVAVVRDPAFGLFAGRPRCSVRGGPYRATPKLVAQVWHSYGMARVRVSTTVDEQLLTRARQVRTGVGDAALIDEALVALLARHRAAELDASYSAYDEHPLDEADEWGDLASFREAAAAS